MNAVPDSVLTSSFVNHQGGFASLNKKEWKEQSEPQRNQGEGIIGDRKILHDNTKERQEKQNIHIV